MTFRTRSTAASPCYLPMLDLSAWLARRRVVLGFVCGAAALWLARPTWTTWMTGCGIAATGEALRIWAAGHLEKNREVTSTGPYQFTAHPLYVGSSIIGVGFAIAAARTIVTLLVGLYLATTLTAAVRRERAFLRAKFGDQYVAYQTGGHADGVVRAASAFRPVGKKFSLERARRNREHRAVAGFCVVAIVLALEAALRG